MDKIQAIENSALIKSIKDLKLHPSKENEDKFFEEFKNAKVIVPVKFKPEPKINDDGSLVLDKNLQINFLLLNDINKNTFYPAFLDFKSFNEWKKENKDVFNITFDYKGFYNLLSNDNNISKGVAIDPFGLNIICNKSLINKLNNDDSNITIAKPIISDPKVYPTTMVNAMFDLLSKKDGVNKAYLKTFITGSKMQFAVILDKNIGDEIFKELNNVALPHSKGIEIVFVNINDEIIKDALKETDVPFYEK